jgi:hypothetical protein
VVSGFKWGARAEGKERGRGRLLIKSVSRSAAKPYQRLAAIAISSLGVEHSSATFSSGLGRVVLEELCKESLTSRAEQSMQT